MAGRKQSERERTDHDEVVDDAMSTTSWDTNDTYGSAVDNGFPDANGGGARSDADSVTQGADAEGKAVDDFKDAVELLTEKR